MMGVLGTKKNGIDLLDQETVEEKLGVFQSMLQELPSKSLQLAIKVLIAILLLVVGIQIIKLIRKLVKKALTRGHADVGVVQFLDSAVKTILYVLLFFMILNNFGIQTTSIVAVLASAGVAVGLALQGSLSNLAGGVLILLLKPFRVGDYIIEDSHKNEGTVTEVSLFYTKLQTIDNKIVVLPNGTLANTSLTNVTASGKRRVDLLFGIAYGADIDHAKEVLLDIMNRAEHVMDEEPKQVFVDKLDASEVTIGVRCYVPTQFYWDVRWYITEQVKKRFDEERIEIPFNQLDVHVREK